jgi:hypothetical protein
MTVIAPPRPRETGDPREESSCEALIEEARSRARRRRRIYGGLAAVLAVAAVAVVPHEGGTSGEDVVPPSKSDAPGLAAVPERSEASSIVAEWVTYGTWVLLYGDGRVLSQMGFGGTIVERRLSQPGWDALRAGDIHLRDVVSGPNPVLRSDVWWEVRSRLYVPSIVALCPDRVVNAAGDTVAADPTDVVALLPSALQPLLRDTEQMFTPTHSTAEGLVYPVECWAVPSEHATTIKQLFAAAPGFLAAGPEHGWSFGYSSSSVELVFGENPILPHGEWMLMPG